MRIKHNCGSGIKGEIVKTKGIIFCGTCGKEFTEKRIRRLKILKKKRRKR